MRGAVGVAVASTIPVLASPQDPENMGELVHRLDEAEKLLAKPLSPEAKKIAREMMKGIDSSTKSRMKQKLPENSEPCTTYVPTTTMRPGSGGRS
jgi:hypothetical protein